MKTPYEVLGVLPTATQEEITKAFRKLAKKHHPDRAGGSTELFQQINTAYQTIGTVDARKAYDEAQAAMSAQAVRELCLQSIMNALQETTLVKVLPRIYTFLDGEKRKHDGIIAQSRKMLGQLNRNRSRFTSITEGKENLFHTAMDALIKGHEQTIAASEATLKMLNNMKQEFSGYKELDVVFDPQAEPQWRSSVSTTLPYGAGGFTSTKVLG